MADIAFSDKAGSSNFTAGGDKRNQIFADLLLNRAELEAYLTSLRRQQYSATPPTNPNTGDMWRCSTTGATYTAGVLYRYSGTAWAQEGAVALNVPNRNTVLQGNVDASGNPTLFEAGTGLACKLNATATPAIFAFMNGNSASTGAQDIIDGIAADSATFWSSLPINSTVYLFVDRSSTGVLSGSYTTIAPVIQNFAPAHSAGLQWIDFNTGKVQSSDGSTWTQRNRVFVGTATTNGTGVTAVNVNISSYFDTLYLGKTATAAKATILATARKINGVDFNGSGDITIADASKLPLAGGTMTGKLVSLSSVGSISAVSGTSTIEVRGSGTVNDAAFMTFHRLGYFAAVLGIDTDNQLKYGGLSVGDVAHKIWHDGNTAGKILQVQNVTKTTSFSGTSVSWTDIPGLSVSITPSSTSNKVLVTANVSAHGDQQNVTVRLMRDTTPIAVSTGSTNNATFQFNDSEEMPTCSIAFLDTPASAAALTYKAQYNCQSGGTFVLNSMGSLGLGAVSAITVEEVKG